MLLPQDIVVLLKLALGTRDLSTAELAAALGMSPSQVHQSLRRAHESRLLLLGPGRGRKRQSKQVQRQALLELLLHGVRYVYPAKVGGETRGVPTFGQFAPTVFESGLQPVWPYAQGETRGLTFEPLAPCVPAAALADSALHLALACVDAVRGGQARERRWAQGELEKMLRAAP
jgi:hypothetical protein